VKGELPPAGPAGIDATIEPVERSSDAEALVVLREGIGDVQNVASLAGLKGRKIR
jgi:hypothetical protein